MHSSRSRSGPGRIPKYVNLVLRMILYDIPLHTVNRIRAFLCGNEATQGLQTLHAGEKALPSPLYSPHGRISSSRSLRLLCVNLM